MPPFLSGFALDFSPSDVATSDKKASLSAPDAAAVVPFSSSFFLIDPRRPPGDIFFSPDLEGINGDDGCSNASVSFEGAVVSTCGDDGRFLALILLLRELKRLDFLTSCSLWLVFGDDVVSCGSCIAVLAISLILDSACREIEGSPQVLPLAVAVARSMVAVCFAARAFSFIAASIPFREEPVNCGFPGDATSDTGNSCIDASSKGASSEGVPVAAAGKGMSVLCSWIFLCIAASIPPFFATTFRLSANTG